MASGKVHTSDATRPFKQDLPPKGGYAPINFKRIPARTLVNGEKPGRPGDEPGFD